MNLTKYLIENKVIIIKPNIAIAANPLSSEIKPPNGVIFIVIVSFILENSE